MNRLLSILVISQWITAQTLNNSGSGKSYYFKIVGNNEFRVLNRVQFLNHNITDYNVNPHPPQNINLKAPPKPVESGNKAAKHKLTEPRNQFQTVPPKKFFLDEEWNFDHRSLNKSDFPHFVKNFYDERVKDPQQDDTLRIFFNTNRNSSSRIIKFDLGGLKSDEDVADADMYFYWPLENTSSIFKTSVVLRLYQFEKQFTNDLNESVLAENPDVHKLFNVIYISKAQSGWQTFKIKKPIDNWANGEDNLGLLLTISSYDQNKLISVFNDTNSGAFRTFAVLNLRKNGTRVSTTSPDDSIEVKPTPSTSQVVPFNSNCSRRPWQLNFKDLHWDQFILFPENGVEVHQCSGKCQLNDQSDMNNHVKLRHFLNGVQGFKVCCVPVRYGSLPIMYLDKFGNVVLKNYDNFIVQECGCR